MIAAPVMAVPAPAAAGACNLRPATGGHIPLNIGAAFIGERITQETGGGSKQAAAHHIIFKAGQPAGDLLAAVNAVQGALHFGIDRLRFRHATRQEELHDLLQLRPHGRGATKHKAIIARRQIFHAAEFIPVKQRQGGLFFLRRQSDRPPLRRAGASRMKSFMYGQLSAIVEPIAGVIGAVAVIYMEPILPFALSFAAGAMIFVVVEEVIPETQRDKYTDVAVLGFIGGFLVMMVLDVALG